MAGSSWSATCSAPLLFATVCAAALALLIVPKATGARPLTVLTGSMKGTYDPGSVVVVKPVRPDQLHVGDTLTYQITSDQPDVITHRVIKIVFTPDGKREFITQGDANGAPDAEPVVAGQVRGTVWYSVPWVGYASTFVQPSNRGIGIKVVSGGLIATPSTSSRAACSSGAAAGRRRRTRLTTTGAPTSLSASTTCWPAPSVSSTCGAPGTPRARSCRGTPAAACPPGAAGRGTGSATPWSRRPASRRTARTSRSGRRRAVVGRAPGATGRAPGRCAHRQQRRGEPADVDDAAGLPEPGRRRERPGQVEADHRARAAEAGDDHEQREQPQRRRPGQQQHHRPDEHDRGDDPEDERRALRRGAG